jgi:hypothetical protein
MKNKFLLTTLLAFFGLSITSVLFAQPYLNWAKLFNSPASQNQYATDIALIDSFIYVASSTGDFNSTDFLLIKMNKQGDTIWSKTLPNYEDPWGSGIGSGTQIITHDKVGNIYIAGTFMFSTDDYLLIKYNSMGDTLWTRRFNGSQNSWDYAKAIAMDKTGNIIITGVAHVGGVNGDCVTIKYDSNGNQLWVKSFDSGNSSWDDYGHKIAIDNNNNIFVAGDFGLIKYDSTGTLKWSKANNPFSQAGGEGVNVKIDKQSNIIYTTRMLNNKISKYDQQGNLLFSNNFSPTGYTVDNRAEGMTLDQNNNVIVTGEAKNGSAWDIATIKYDASLIQKWQKIFANNSPNYITADTSNSVYITGNKFLLLKYDSTGTMKWDTTYTNINITSSSCVKLILDSVNNIFMTGYANNGTNTDVLTLKYSPIFLTSIEQIQLGRNGFTIYPNPFSTQTTLQTDNILHNATLTVVNCFGQTVKQIKNISGQTVTLHRDNLSSGLYFLRITQDTVSS